MKISLLINVQMPTIVGIFKFISTENFMPGFYFSACAQYCLRGSCILIWFVF